MIEKPGVFWVLVGSLVVSVLLTLWLLIKGKWRQPFSLYLVLFVPIIGPFFFLWLQIWPPQLPSELDGHGAGIGGRYLDKQIGGKRSIHAGYAKEPYKPLETEAGALPPFWGWLLLWVGVFVFFFFPSVETRVVAIAVGLAGAIWQIAFWIKAKRRGESVTGE